MKFISIWKYIGIIVGLWITIPIPAHCNTGADMRVVWKGYKTPLHILRVKASILIPLNEMLLLSLTPHYFPNTGKFSLTAPKWRLQGQIGKRNYILNGVTRKFSIAPQLVDWDVASWGFDPRKFPFIPLEEIAVKRGYSLSPSNRHELTAPAVKPSKGEVQFDGQTIVLPMRKKQGNLVFEPILNLRPKSGEIAFRILNKGKQDYYGTKVFIFLEMSNGIILSGDAVVGSETGNVGEMIKPKSSERIGSDPLLFPTGNKVGIKRIMYADGEHFLEWNVKETPPNSK